MRDNHHLRRGKREKNDEFYTLYKDIESELSHYSDQLSNKIIYCNSDLPGKSNFIKYFQDNFQNLNLKKLIATGYNPDGPGSLYIKDKDIDFTGRLLWDGDFRSVECVDLMKESDVVVTNPPFSLFRDFLNMMMEKKKKFLIIGNINAMTYKEVFPLFRANKIHFGHYAGNGVFEVPIDYPLHEAIAKYEDGKKFIVVQGIRWYTNLDVSKEKKPIPLVKHYSPDLYPKYDNYDAIDVSRTRDIPCDYNGVMGVPITFLDKYNPKQFELVKFRKGDDEKDLRVGGKCPYFRVLIRNLNSTRENFRKKETQQPNPLS